MSHNTAAEAISAGKILVDGLPVFENIFIGPYHKIVYKNEVISDPDSFKYFVYHKPKGIECTLNPAITESLVNSTPTEISNLFYAGRLDKLSEGLLLLTNDGNVYNKIIRPEQKLPKLYEVILENDFDETFIQNMERGVEIRGKITLPCKVYRKSSNSFEIELTQGLNRQIRRMCFALGNYVIQLKRLRIGIINLGFIAPGEFRKLTVEEVFWLRNL